jgi:hypothetical protein
LKDCIRQKSKHLNGKLVGTDVLGAIIPHKASLAPFVTAIGHQANVGLVFDNSDDEYPMPDDMCLFFTRFSTGRDTGVYHAPHVVATHFKNFKIWAPPGFAFDLKGKVLLDNGGHVIIFAGAEVRRKRRK